MRSTSLLSSRNLYLILHTIFAACLVAGRPTENGVPPTDVPGVDAASGSMLPSLPTLVPGASSIFTPPPAPTIAPIDSNPPLAPSSTGPSTLSTTTQLNPRKENKSPPPPPPPPVPYGTTDRIMAKDNFPFDGVYCEVGLWETPTPDLRSSDFIGHEWTGRPFVGPTAPGSCIDIQTINGNLDKRISAYKMNGRCYCTFYEEKGCKKELFAAGDEELIMRVKIRNDIDLTLQPTENMNLDESQPGWEDRISSMRCDAVPSHNGEVYLHGEIYGINRLPVKKNGELEPNSYDVMWTEGGLGDCKGLNAAIRGKIRSYKITNISCIFWNDDACGESRGDTPRVVLAAGGPGVVQEEVLDGVIGDQIRSYKCWNAFEFRINSNMKDGKF